MQATPLTSVTPSSAAGWQRWLVLLAGARIVLFAALLLGSGVLIRAAVVALDWTGGSTSPLLHALASLSLQLAPALIGYLLVVTLIERRRARFRAGGWRACSPVRCFSARSWACCGCSAATTSAASTRK